MAKKDFSSIGASTGSTRAERVYSSLEQATNQQRHKVTASPQEQEERRQALQTQGRKGCKAGRINMAFSPDNMTFIRMMSKATGMTMTKFTNAIIAAYRNEHPEFLQQAQALLKAVETSTFSAQITPDQSGTDQTDDK